MAGIVPAMTGVETFQAMTMMSPSPNNQGRSLINSAAMFAPISETPPVYDICVHNLTYKVICKLNKDVTEKTLLNNVSARANHGEVLAIVGPSGSSKTTFLDVLAGQIDQRSLKGQILVNGKPVDPTFKRVSGYVMQDDALYPNLTTRETLMFSARLRLPGSMNFEEKQERVNSLIKLLGLTECADTYVGDQKVSGISGGERRRVSIGVDLIHDPAVLLIDEPTSGLDSTSALHVVQILSEMAIDRQRTVLLTIHQPGYRILDTINKYLVLARGNVIFHGDGCAMMAYFNGLGYTMPENTCIVEFALDVVEACQDQFEDLEHLIACQAKYQHAKEVESMSIDDPWNTPQASVETFNKPTFATSFISELFVLGHRSFLVIFRSKVLFYTRAAVMILTGFTMATLYLHAQHNYRGILQRTGYFNFSLILLIFSSNEALPIFLSERQIYIRESMRGAYRTSPYVISQMVMMLPFLFFLAILFSVTSYFLVGLVMTATAFFTFVITIFLTLFVSNSFVAFIASVVPDEHGSQIIVTAIGAFFYLFSGLFVPRTSIPKYWIWMHYLSNFKYPYESLLQNEYGNLKGVIWYSNVDSETVLKTNYAAGKVHIWINLLVMVCFAIGYRFLFYLALKFKTKDIRK